MQSPEDKIISLMENNILDFHNTIYNRSCKLDAKAIIYKETLNLYEKQFNIKEIINEKIQRFEISVEE